MYISKDGYMETFVVNETSEDVRPAWPAGRFDNMMVMSTTSVIVQETHYDPWGLELTGLGYQYGGIKANKFLYNGKELIEDNGLQYYDYGARMYDATIGRWSVVDPMADQREWLSPYNYVQNNPILRIDPTGALDGEYEKDEEGNWEKVSTVGDEIGVDFYHTDQKDKQITYVTDRKGNWNSITNGRAALEGVERGLDVNWKTIYNEWSNGYGPEKSIFEGGHPANDAIGKHHLFGKALHSFNQSGEPKKAYEVDFTPIWNNLTAEGGPGFMQIQMMGSYNASFYKLGNKTLSLVQDSKSRTSFYYHLPVTNYDRGSRIDINKDGSFSFNDRKANTYQSYLFFTK